jgi:hypothetical protein
LDDTYSEFTPANRALLRVSYVRPYGAEMSGKEGLLTHHFSTDTVSRVKLLAKILYQLSIRDGYQLVKIVAFSLAILKGFCLFCG